MMILGSCQVCGAKRSDSADLANIERADGAYQTACPECGPVVAGRFSARIAREMGGRNRQSALDRGKQFEATDVRDQLGDAVSLFSWGQECIVGGWSSLMAANRLAEQRRPIPSGVRLVRVDA